ncbi:MAG TPA: hypothetical protein PKN13_08975 [Accumulibacter sp.]|nr:hypothetical protein [Accumulibacter sp.]HMX22749.1 hypothetical protein [Accumulibacter sp.]HMY06144.1 hypothetical protein [Accumulibacter sp.]HND80679.1 hypothetical protein [Accumulibacter sp.]HNE13346.1 hypothetical protein [Accumulibacter sp.]
MKLTRLTLRRLLLIGLGFLSINVFANVSALPTERSSERATTLTSRQSNSDSPQRIDASGKQAITSLSPQISNTETIDSARWTHGGDANANDVALFRRFIGSRINDNELSLTGLLSVAGLLFGGIAYGQHQRKKSKPQTESKQPSYFPV